MTSTATAAARRRALIDQQADQVREGGPYRHAPRYAQHKPDVQRPAVRPMRVHEAYCLLLLGTVELVWLVALVYGIIRLLP